MYPSPAIATTSITPSLSTSPIAGDEPMKPTDDGLACVSVQISSPLVPLIMRSMPFSHVLTAAPLQPQHVPATLPAVKTTTGESSVSILASQVVAYMRPTVGVDHTSVSSGLVFAVGPHCHSTLALSIPVPLGWYSHCSRQEPPSGSVPASPGQVGGMGRHRPLTATDVHPPASLGAPASVPRPMPGSQY